MGGGRASGDGLAGPLSVSARSGAVFALERESEGPAEGIAGPLAETNRVVSGSHGSVSAGRRQGSASAYLAARSSWRHPRRQFSLDRRTPVGRIDGGVGLRSWDHRRVFVPGSCGR